MKVSISYKFKQKKNILTLKSMSAEEIRQTFRRKQKCVLVWNNEVFTVHSLFSPTVDTISEELLAFSGLWGQTCEVHVLQMLNFQKRFYLDLKKTSLC